MQVKGLMKQVREGGRLVLGEDRDGVLWASNSYWAVAMREPEAHPIGSLLRSYNLEVGPGHYDAWTQYGTLMPKQNAGPVDFEANVVGATRDVRIQLEPMRLGKYDVEIRLGNGCRCLVFQRPEDAGLVIVQRSYAEMVKRLVRNFDGSWEQCTEGGQVKAAIPRLAYIIAGRVEAVLMPIRVDSITECAEKEAVSA